MKIVKVKISMSLLEQCLFLPTGCRVVGGQGNDEFGNIILVIEHYDFKDVKNFNDAPFAYPSFKKVESVAAEFVEWNIENEEADET